MSYASPLSDILRIGTVIEVDLAEALARVELGEAYESDWMPWAPARTGATRIWSPPSVGEQVIILCPDADLESGFIVAGLFCDQFPPPESRAVDVIQFGDDAVIRYDSAAHKLEAILPAGGEVILTAPAKLTVNAAGGFIINGDITLNGKLTASDDVLAGAISLKNHKHGQVQTGSAQSGKPL